MSDQFPRPHFMIPWISKTSYCAVQSRTSKGKFMLSKMKKSWFGLWGCSAGKNWFYSWVCFGIAPSRRHSRHMKKFASGGQSRQRIFTLFAIFRSQIEHVVGPNRCSSWRIFVKNSVSAAAGSLLPLSIDGELNHYLASWRCGEFCFGLGLSP